MKPVALVTGCSDGIGLEVSRELKRLGFLVIGVSRRNECPDGIFDRYFVCDLSIQKDVENLCKHLLEYNELARCSMLVHCAGSLHVAPALGSSSSEAQRQVQLHYLTPLTLNAALGSVIIEHQGTVVLVGSISAAHSAPLLSLYSSSKAALKRYSEGLRRETRGTGLRVVYAELGNINTDFSRKALESGLEQNPLSYKSLFERFSRLAAQARDGGSSPKKVAKRLLQLAMLERPPRTVYLGRGLARSFFFRVLPTGWLDAIYYKLMGAAKKR